MDVEKGFGKFIGGFAIIWFISAILSLAVTGVFIWAIISLVLHYT